MMYWNIQILSFIGQESMLGMSIQCTSLQQGDLRLDGAS